MALGTGAGSGIGAAVARRSGADVSDVDQVGQVVERVTREHGRRDVVVHAAGGGRPGRQGAGPAGRAACDEAGRPRGDRGDRVPGAGERRRARADRHRHGGTHPAGPATGQRRPAGASYATPEEIADIALFLASDRASNLVGAVPLANGGRFTR